MRILFEGSNENLQLAIQFVNQLLEDEAFYNSICSESIFADTKYSPNEIADFIKKKIDKVEVKLYTLAWPRHRSTNAYVGPKFPNTIFYNSTKLTNSVETMVGTIMHEYVHSVDFTADGNSEIEYGHPSRYDLKTAPVVIGNLAEQFYKNHTPETANILFKQLVPEMGFSGEPLTRWDGFRNMVLVEEFYFIDSNGFKWVTPAGSCLNGATIPRALWSSIGSPFTGRYRRASVVHDYAVGELCNPDVEYDARTKADRMFYEACRFDGCSKIFAGILYVGVRFGTWSAQISSGFMEDELQGTEAVRRDSESEYVYSKFWNVIDTAQNAINNEDLDELDKIIQRELN